MNTLKTLAGRILFTFIFTGLGAEMAFSQGIDFGDNNTEFGLFPTTTPKTKHVLPNCEDVNDIESLPGVVAHAGYCLGPIESPTKTYDNKYAITLIEEYFDKDGVIRVVKRNPILMSVATFYNFCRPLGGFFSSDGMYCEYKVKF